MLNKNCREGNHKLIVISSVHTNAIPNTYKVTRWCSQCGAIVVDIDSDGQTFPGKVLKMKSPQLMLDELNNQNKQLTAGINGLICRANSLYDSTQEKDNAKAPIEIGRAAWERQGLIYAIKVLCKEFDLDFEDMFESKIE